MRNDAPVRGISELEQPLKSLQHPMLYVISISEYCMNVTQRESEAPWLLLVFTLPVAKASERVGVWRKLQRYGALGLPASGYVLPNNPANQERFEWLATSIRNARGQAAVAQVSSFDNLPNERIEEMFNKARSRDYEDLEKELKKVTKTRRQELSETALSRLKKRLQQI